MIRLEVHGPVALLVIDRPAKLNSFNLAMLEELAAGTERIKADHSIRAVVVTGAGDEAFSAGGDLASLLPATAAAGIDIINPEPTRRFFSDLYKPVVAAVRGKCIGGGLEILLGTDLRIAGSDAQFGLGEVRWGLIPGAGTHVRLPRQVPWAAAMELLLLGRPIDAERAYQIGLVNEVAQSDQVLDRAMAVATELAANAPLAVQTAKEIAVRALRLEDGFALEWSLNSRVLRSNDAKEGPAAFVEKRRPDYTGT
jgi:enoyl-CoA hydratase/carnithine racemase